MMTILNTLKPLLADIFGREEEEITPAVSFTEDLGADEMDLVEVAMTVEEEFDLHIEDETLSGIATVGDLIELIDANAKE